MSTFDKPQKIQHIKHLFLKHSMHDKSFWNIMTITIHSINYLKISPLATEHTWHVQENTNYHGKATNTNLYRISSIIAESVWTSIWKHDKHSDFSNWRLKCNNPGCNFLKHSGWCCPGSNSLSSSYGMLEQKTMLHFMRELLWHSTKPTDL